MADNNEITALETMGLIAQAIKKALTEGYQATKKFAAEKILPATGKYLLFLVLLALLAFIPSVGMFYFGITRDSKLIIIASGLWNAFFLTLFMLAATPLGIAYQTMKGGFSGSGQRFLSAMEAVLITKLLVTLLACFIAFKNNLSLVPVFLFTAFLLGFIAPKAFNPKLAAGVVALFFIGMIVSFQFPMAANTLKNKLEKLESEISSPKRVNVTLQQIRSGEISFFNQDGSPTVYYFTNRKGEFELYDGPGVNIYGEKLKPITKEVVATIEQILEEEPKKSMETAQPAPATPPAMIPAPEKPQLNLSGMWEFCWEKPSDFQGSNPEVRSSCFNAQVEQVDNSSVTITPLKKGVIFKKTRLAGKILEGTWEQPDPQRETGGEILLQFISSNFAEGWISNSLGASVPMTARKL